MNKLRKYRVYSPENNWDDLINSVEFYDKGEN